MKKSIDLRGSLLAKCIALLLLIATETGALLCCCIVIAQSYGYGVSQTFEEDPLFQEKMDIAMNIAMQNVIDPSYYSYELQNRYGGFSAQIYDGEPAEDTLVGTWSDIPENIWLQRTNTFSSSSASSGYFTVAGYLSSPLPNTSVFQRNFLIYTHVRSFSYGVTIMMTVLLIIASLGLLIFLFCAAGHRAHKPGIYPNRIDKIPLDIYLPCIVILLTVLLEFCVEFLRFRAAPLPIFMMVLFLFIWAVSLVALSVLLTIATRLKLGKWWRNTICYGLIHWWEKIWKRSWKSITDFIYILPMTWRSVVLVGSILVVQTFLTLLMFETYEGGFFFLIALVWDTALIVGAAFLTRQLQLVMDMGKRLAAGDLEVKLDTKKLLWDVKVHAECLNAIGTGMNEAVERRMHSERLKTELITNVSHDIKTPLTSIVNYVDLLKKEDLPPAAAEYVAVLDRQSSRLKKLTEDLVEASKASTGNMTVHLEPIVINEIIHQAVGDYDERLSAGKLEVIVNTYEGNLIAFTDGRLLWRVLDNLLSNVCKYAMPGTRVYVDLGTQDGFILLTMKNISRDPLNINADELMERFVRGDASRHTEGSGLGLNIARSLMDLMGGSFRLSVDGDLFKAELILNMMAQKPLEKPIELSLANSPVPKIK